MTGIDQAIVLAGGPSAMGRHLGVSRQRVQHWRRQGYAPAGYVVEIEAEYGVPRKLLVHPGIVELLAGAFE